MAKKRAAGPAVHSISVTGVRTYGLLLLGALLVATGVLHNRRRGAAAIGGGSWVNARSVHGPVLISYAYFEKDEVQMRDFEFFMAVGMGFDSSFSAPPSTHFSIVVMGDACGPCAKLYPHLTELVVPDDMPWLKQAHATSGLTLLWRKDNEGMDFAAHNATLEWFQRSSKLRRYYRYFIFLNSSVRGPFYPNYMPPGWSWTRAYSDHLRGDVKAVSSSLVCLPKGDAGGFGPKLESWAFALDGDGLEALMEAGTFSVRTCKLCEDGVVVRGEYGISTVLLDKGYNIATLMSKYPKDTDWRDSRHWYCNNQAHPSRHGTYDGISMHPYEVVFVKASWHVGEPYVGRYTSWRMDEAQGVPTTHGEFDQAMYHWAIQLEAQEEPRMDTCFDVLSYDVRTNTPIDRTSGFQRPAHLQQQQQEEQQEQQAGAAVRALRGERERQEAAAADGLAAEGSMGKAPGRPLMPADYPSRFGKPIFPEAMT